MAKARCLNCNFEEEFEQEDVFTANYYQCIGTCPHCDTPTVDGDGIPTKTNIFYLTQNNNIKDDQKHLKE